jgi:hypothetical protein
LVEANAPRLIAHKVYGTSGGTGMTIVRAHHDSASLVLPIDVAGQHFPIHASDIRLLAIDTCDTRAGEWWQRCREKAQMLGRGLITCHGR